MYNINMSIKNIEYIITIKETTEIIKLENQNIEIK